MQLFERIDGERCVLSTTLPSPPPFSPHTRLGFEGVGRVGGGAEKENGLHPHATFGENPDLYDRHGREKGGGRDREGHAYTGRQTDRQQEREIEAKIRLATIKNKKIPHTREQHTHSPTDKVSISSPFSFFASSLPLSLPAHLIQERDDRT